MKEVLIALFLALIAESSYTEREALCDIRNTWRPSSWIESLYDPCHSESYCSNPPSPTIICKNGHVTSMNFENAQIFAQIPVSISGLKYLEELNLKGNFLYGPVPDGMIAFSQLRTFDVRDNGLFGNIEFITNLTQVIKFKIDRNKFSGVLPSEINAITSLKELTLAANALSGPVSLHSLTQLTHLDISWNLFSGSFPQIQNSKLLEHLILSETSISGTIPDWIGHFSNLQELITEDCFLGGVIPETIVSLTKLRSLLVSFNYFQNIPLGILKLTSLTELSLGSNNFTGIIPEGIGNLQQLTLLNLEDNHFEGPIPKSINNLTLLDFLDISDNRLSGSIPDLSKLKALKTFDFSDNYISGSIPDWLSTLPIIRSDMSFTNITGDFPEALCDSQLIYIDLLGTNIKGRGCQCCTKHCFCKDKNKVSENFVISISYSIIGIATIVFIGLVSLLVFKNQKLKRRNDIQNKNQNQNTEEEKPLVPAGDMHLQPNNTTSNI